MKGLLFGWLSCRHFEITLGRYCDRYKNYFLQTIIITILKARNTMQPQHHHQTPAQSPINRPLHQSFIASPPSSAPFQPLRVINQPSFVQPQSAMYKSTIQPASSAALGGGLGGSSLQSMGRTVRQDGKQLQQLTENTAVFPHKKPQPLTFRAERPQRPKMASSVIFYNKTVSEGFNRYPPQNSPNSQQQNGPVLTGLDFLASKARCVKEEEGPETVEERRPLVSQMEDHRKNRQMFKSSIQGQSSLKSAGSFSQITFDKPFSNTVQKKWELHRNTPAKGDTNQVKQKNEQKPEENATPKKSAVPINPATLKVQENSTSESGMFKKKNIYAQQGSQGKTDENLLKMLGINLKGASSPTNVAKTLTFEPALSDKKTNEPKGQSVSSAAPASPGLTKFSRDDFKIGKKMGKGQFGEVMVVQHKLTGFLCGMKTMSKKEIKSQKYESQIARQLSIQFYLQHRHVTPLYGYFQDPENIYLLIEFCTDGQLLQKLRKTRRMQEQDVSPIIREICEGLDNIHKEEIIHRDIKPQNILFNFGTVKISDFGWAVHSGNGMRKTISGSPLYYSPEIVQETSYDEKIDIWSIGMMTYECLLGKIPFRIYSQLDLNRIVSDDIQFPQYVDVSPEAQDFILRIMKKKPEERMEMRQILRHPFITKYAKDRKIAPEVMEQFRSVVRV